MTQKLTKRLGVNNPEIQGLYPFKKSSQSFWTLKAKIELAIFNEHKKGETKT